uniref:Uncharacterized protein n=1 Tax=Anguilla anguilla TaxID=7936 RepID=A0A0E9PJ99_ANGAN
MVTQFNGEVAKEVVECRSGDPGHSHEQGCAVGHSKLGEKKGEISLLILLNQGQLFTVED